MKLTSLMKMQWVVIKDNLPFDRNKLVKKLRKRGMLARKKMIFCYRKRKRVRNFQQIKFRKIYLSRNFRRNLTKGNEL